MLQKAEKIWMDGKLVKWDEAKTHVLTHSLHYGAAVFEGIRCYNTKAKPAVFRLKDHTDRMFNSAKAIEIKIPFSKEEIRNAIKETVRVNKLRECYIRPIAYYGYGVMGLSPRGSPVNVAVAVWPWGKYLGEESIVKGVKCIISKWRRIDKTTLPTYAKVCGFYVNSILAHKEAEKAGCDEAILLNTDGNVAEGPGENIFIVKNGVLITPPLSAGILPGITRKSIVEIAKDMKIRIREMDITKQQLLNSDEALFTGTAAEVTPITKINGKVIGNGKRGPITEILQSKFYEVVHGEDKKYIKWLDFV